MKKLTDDETQRYSVPKLYLVLNSSFEEMFCLVIFREN